MLDMIKKTLARWLGPWLREYTPVAYEVVDVSDEEGHYYALGMFPTLTEAISALVQHPEPWNLSHLSQWSDSITLEIRERDYGLTGLDVGRVLWRRQWVNDYDEEKDEYKWVIRTKS